MSCFSDCYSKSDFINSYCINVEVRGHTEVVSQLLTHGADVNAQV